MSDEPRPFASLSSSLLARRGMARPAMRPQAIRLSEGQALSTEEQALEDLGWNDMGEEPVLTHPVVMPGMKAAPQPVPSPVVEQQDEIRRSFAPSAHAPQHGPAPVALANAKGKAAFTLRIDADRHLKLRLLCALQNRSAQQLITQALDDLLAANADHLPTLQPSHNHPQGNQS